MYYYFICLYLLSLINITISKENTNTIVKFCVINEFEYAKCEAFSQATLLNSTISTKFTILCVIGIGVFDCMSKIDKGEAHILNLDVGLAYYAMQNFGIAPFAFESYNSEREPLRMNLKYTSNAVIAKGSFKEPKDLKGSSACFAKVGSAESWTYPLAKMIDKAWLKVENCNSEVKNANGFFTSGSCVPESAYPIFNRLGDNGNLSCSMCKRKSDNRRYCKSLDPYAGNAGAMNCLKAATKEGKKAVAFVRGDIIPRMIARNDLDESKYELLCPEKQKKSSQYTASLSDYQSCNWGQPHSRMLVTKLTNNKVSEYEELFKLVVNEFGPNSSHPSNFFIFQSNVNYTISSQLKIILGQSGDSSPPQPPYDLMFSDLTQNIYFPKPEVVRNLFISTSDFMTVQHLVANCPIPGVKWCVISNEEMNKCAKMKLALDMRQIQPKFNCVFGESTTNCMRLINQGFADLITLDAAEVYVAGKFLNLVPIAIEYYGDDTSYYAVAVVKKENRGLLISNWKYKKTCHSGAGKATGWIVPLNVALETVQMRVFNNKLTYAFGELIGRACIPGILNKEYNPEDSSPLNLCEICAAGGADRCQPDSRELYYGDSGSFRCLLESGDIAFTRHTTVHDNTDGRNPVHWARSRRSDDYEILCADGRRVSPYDYKECNLAKIPGNMVVTGNYKTKAQRDAMWRMLRYAQEYYSSDNNEVFQMFASPFGYSDLIFSDSAVSLKPISYENQSYEKILTRSFKREVENLELIGKMVNSGLFNSASSNFCLFSWFLTYLTTVAIVTVITQLFSYG